MKVKLLFHTPQPERVVAAAARLCYSPAGAEQLLEQMDDQQVKKLVEKISRLGHLSTFEHVNYTFAVEGISRVLSHQLVRHRIASYSQQSQRYVIDHDFQYVVPPSIAADQQALARFKDLMAAMRAAYNDLLALGIKQEDARYCFANAAETKIMITMNARTLLHFFQVRCCRRAQWEIRQMADEMLKQVRAVSPVIFAKAGPTCITEGYCGEGEMTCGRLKGDG